MSLAVITNKRCLSSIPSNKDKSSSCGLADLSSLSLLFLNNLSNSSNKMTQSVETLCRKLAIPSMYRLTMIIGYCSIYNRLAINFAVNDLPSPFSPDNIIPRLFLHRLYDAIIFLIFDSCGPYNFCSPSLKVNSEYVSKKNIGKALEEVSTKRGTVAFTAKMTLKLWNEGKLKFD